MVGGIKICAEQAGHTAHPILCRYNGNLSMNGEHAESARGQKKVLHATEALHDLCVTGNSSTQGIICGEVVSFHFPIEGYAVYPKQAGSFYFVPAGLIQGLKNRP